MLPLGSFIFPRSWAQTDFKGPIKIFQSFNLAEYLFHRNCGEGKGSEDRAGGEMCMYLYDFLSLGQHLEDSGQSSWLLYHVRLGRTGMSLNAPVMGNGGGGSGR